VERSVIGDPKVGLTLQIQQTPTTMVLQARPDPLVLYIVIIATFMAGVVGALSATPKAGIVSILTFIVIFAPLITVLTFSAARVRCQCVLDHERDVVEIDERSYTRRLQRVRPLEDVEAVVIRKMPTGLLSGGTVSFGIFLALRDVDYMAACSTNEAAVAQDASRLARFLDVPLETPGEVVPRRQSRQGVLLMTAVLYLGPIVLAVSALLFLSNPALGIEPSLVGFLSAVVISQIGAILAFAYYRMRRPYET
jgi:hypothetical protein